MGMARALAFRRIVLPQAWRASLPGMVNEMTFLVESDSRNRSHWGRRPGPGGCKDCSRDLRTAAPFHLRHHNLRDCRRGNGARPAHDREQNC